MTTLYRKAVSTRRDPFSSPAKRSVDIKQATRIWPRGAVCTMSDSSEIYSCHPFLSSLTPDRSLMKYCIHRDEVLWDRPTDPTEAATALHSTCDAGPSSVI
ncbi:hypothetical protein JTB14_008099 [Gonioctena quinquepunctata]|nr:hypothetical protein JTB14_008099 [Gonioctena quinquepunctata]